MLCFQGGKYNWKKETSRSRHEATKEIAKFVLRFGADIVVCNTFTCLWEMEPYFAMAKLFNADVEVIKMCTMYASIHGVPEETIRTMKERWEPFHGEIEIKDGAK